MRNKNIIIALFTAGTLLAGTGVAFAGGPKHKGPNVDKRVEKMTQHLELDDAQAAKIKSILEASRSDLEALRDSKGDREGKREQMKLIRQSTKAEIDAVLTPDQLAKAEKFRQNKKRKHMKRGKGQMKRMAKELDLTDAQKTKVREITQTARGDIRTIVQDDFGGDRAAAKESVKARRAKMVADIKAELTPEQAEKFAELEQRRSEHKGKRGKGKRGKGLDN